MLLFLLDFLLTIMAVIAIPFVLLLLLSAFLTWGFADAVDRAYVGGFMDGAKLLKAWAERRNVARKSSAVTYAVCAGIWGTAGALFFGILLPVAVLLVAPNDFDAGIALLVGSIIGLLMCGTYGTYMAGSGITVTGSPNA